MKMGVVADDITGSNDIGIMFAKHDYVAHVYSFKRSSGLANPDETLVKTDGFPGTEPRHAGYHCAASPWDREASLATRAPARSRRPPVGSAGEHSAKGERSEWEGRCGNPTEQAKENWGAPDILILDTNSRLDPPQVAYDKVFAATRQLQQAGCRQFHNKTCSVFRGNIGAEFDAMLDALGLDFAVVVLGFPKNGRTTVDGIHYVHGKKLEDSEFRRDPIHPMLRSDLVGILQSQTKRKVALMTHEVIDRGAEELRTEIQHMRTQCQYLILDVTDQSALGTIAHAVYDEAVICGSSAIAEELPAVWGPSQAHAQLPDLPLSQGLGILVVAGSLMPQTAAQIDHLQKQGAPCFTLGTSRLFDSTEREAEIGGLAASIMQDLRVGKDVVFHSSNDPHALETASRIGFDYGASKTEVSRLVSETLAEVTARVLAETGQNRLVVAGGETSAAVCTRLGVDGMRVWKEIQPGLPSCVSLNDPPRMLVLKSGSFGKPDFFERALEQLRES